MMGFITILWLFGVFSVGTGAKTHWVVTESGLIKPRIDAPFELGNSFDLLAFLGQETRWGKIIKCYYELKNMQPAINKLWERVVLETDFLTYETVDDNCMKSGLLKMLDWFTSELDDGWTIVPMEEFLITNPMFGQDVEVPDCKKISSLTYSMAAFDHLESVMNRDNLSFTAEPSLPESVSSIMTLDQFGHWLANTLRKNNSSWLHYNMASLYWRVRGNAPKAMECSRRAVHYAPRQFKDIALLNMGTILHRCRKTENAITVLKSAVHHKPRVNSHFVLANAYAVAGQFNYSVRYYKRCLKANPDFLIAETNMCGVKCISVMFRKMKIVRKVLSQLQQELNKFNDKETYWLKLQALFLLAMELKMKIDHKDLVQLSGMMSRLTRLDMTSVRKHGDKNALILYFLDEGIDWTMNGVLDFEAPYKLQRLVMHIEKHSGTDSGYTRRVDHFSDGTHAPEFKATPTGRSVPGTMNVEVKITRSAKFSNPTSSKGPAKSNKVDDNMAEFEVGKPLYPASWKINRNNQDFDRDPEWPSIRLCKEEAHTFPQNIEAIYPVFLPFENKGISLKWLLNERIGVPVNVEHDLPWHPPTCPQDKESSSMPKKSSKQPIGEVVASGYLRKKLLAYVGGGDETVVAHMQDAEIGQRIYSVMHKKLAPKWLVYTLSSLYWRVRGNKLNAVQCLLNAGRTTPTQFRDIPLISLSSVMLEMGFVEEALSLAEEAFRLSLYEPATNFILAQLNMVKKHRNTHIFHLKQVVRVEPDFLGGVARNLLMGWACVIKQADARAHDIDFGEGDMCTQVEPGTSMVCEKDGSNCHMSKIQCFSGQDRDTSSLLRMLKENQPEAFPDTVDMTLFDSIVERKPVDPQNMAGHRKIYQELMTTLDRVCESYGTNGCANIQPSDLNLKQEDCTHQHLQLDYWLHLINFKQQLIDSNIKLPAEIPSMAPSSKKEPECRLSTNPSKDFFLERLNRVDAEDWDPVLSLMHQFAEVYEYYDYTTLGSKIAAYVDTRPRDWLGALGAGWWCGAGGRGGCARSCLTAAFHLAPAHHAALALRALATLLHIQARHEDANDVAFLAFYFLPKSKIEAFLVAVSYTYMAEYDKAVWMYRYSLMFDDQYLPAKACLHASMCLRLFGVKADPKIDST